MMEKMEKQVRLDMVNIVQKLPHEIVLEILSRLDLESLCVSAPVCRSLRTWVSITLSSLSSLDLSEFSPNFETLYNLTRNNTTIQSLTLDCTRLDDSSIYLFAKESLHELVLFKCYRFSSNIFTYIGNKCSKLRILKLEVGGLSAFEQTQTFMKAMDRMINSCMLLESLHIKFSDMAFSWFNHHTLVLPKRIKTFFLQYIWCEKALLLVPMCSGLQSLTLVLDGITDELVVLISQNIPNLTELCLEDKPWEDVPLNNDLSNHGILSMCLCRNLKRLSLTRGRENYSSASFKRVNDVGIMHLAEGLDELEVVRLAGFYRVTDAGYTSILHSCKKLRRFEIANAHFLSDLTFHDLANDPRCLVDVRLISCCLLTSETAACLSFCENLEVLDLSGCRSIADVGLKSISKLCKLTTLDLSGADITDDGLSTLRTCSSPVTSLSLRGCKRISDWGMSTLLNGESSFCRTLTTLDAGCVPGMSDRVVATISEHCKELTSLSIRYCFYVSDVSIKILGLKTVAIRRLDLYNCCSLSVKSFEHLRRPFFSKLRWLGVGKTMLCHGSKELLAYRSGLNVCVSGCEMYCDVGLRCHEFV